MSPVPACVPVALGSCSHYSELSLDHIARLLLSISFKSDDIKGKTVLLKPNLVSDRAMSCGCTHPLFVRSVAIYFLSFGCRVLVGDSPAFGSAKKVAKNQGVTAALDDLDVEIVNFDEKQLCTLSSGHKVNIAKAVLDCDLFVNLPKIKAHGQMYVSLAVKNVFGIVTGIQKGSIHMKYGGDNETFTDLIVALQEWLPRQLVLGDGIVVMHKSGPISGESFPLGVIAASENAFAFDTALLETLQLNHARSPLWKKAYEKGVLGACRDHCYYPMAQPSDFAGSGFQAPYMLAPIRFSFLRFIKSIFKRLLHLPFFSN